MMSSFRYLSTALAGTSVSSIRLVEGLESDLALSINASISCIPYYAARCLMVTSCVIRQLCI